MFDAITYKNKTSFNPGPLIDIGALAEGLLFYKRVAIVANAATVRSILETIPPYILLSLLCDGRIEFYYLADQIAVSTTPMSNGRSLHGLLTWSYPDHALEKFIPKAFKEAAGNTSQAKFGANQFLKHVRSLDHSEFNHESVLEAFSDNGTTESTVKSLIQKVVPNFNFQNALRFRIERDIRGFYVDSNIDFENLNKCYHENVSHENTSLEVATILAHLQGTFETTYYAALLNTEIAVNPIERALQSTALESLVRRYTHSISQIESFADLVLANGHGIREAINSGSVPFSSVVELLDSADKFRHWLHNQPADANLVRSYYQETIKDSWVEKLPAKSIRWGIFTGSGLIIDAFGMGGFGTAAGVAVSAIDAFLVDKLLKKWKPHQFVEGDFKLLFNSEQK